MQFGDSFLPESGWTLTNATMNAGSLVISAGGSASITLTEVENTNLLPEALRVLLTASSYTPTYAPTSFARIHIEYEDDNTYDAILPIVNNFNGFMAILWPSISNYEGINVGAFTSLTFSIFSSTGITLSSWSLAKSLNDYLKTDTLYHGIRITTENGFEAIRSDNYARTYFNSDTFAMQVGDGTGDSWTNKVYFDPVKGNYVFDGVLSANVIQAVEAEIDVVISETTVTQVLYAEKGNISELTVDQLDTSDMVQKYLQSDKSSVHYIKIFGQHMQFIEADTDGSQSAQLLDRKGRPMYWLDEERTSVTYTETDWPVMVYVYVEHVKLDLLFEQDPVSGFQVPKMIWGAGSGEGDKEKGFIYKDNTGLVLEYVASSGKRYTFRLGENGVEVPFHPLSGIDLYADGMITHHGPAADMDWSWTKDGSGRITSITNNTSSVTTTVTWSSGNKPGG